MTDFASKRELLFSHLKSAPTGLSWCRLYSEFIDGVITDGFVEAAGKVGRLSPISVVAVGGYGRRELSPHSDIDLVIIPLDENDPNTEPTIRALHQSVTDRLQTDLRLKVDYGFRPVDDATSLDPTSRTGFLDARLVAGEPRPLTEFMDSFWDSFPRGQFLIAKLSERAQKLSRTHETPLVLTPDLFNGAGGLRCVHTGDWIRAALGLRPGRATEAQDFIQTVRNLVHIVAGSKQDLLSPGMQVQCAELLGMEVRNFMERVHLALIENHDRYRQAVRQIQFVQFELQPGVESVVGEVRVHSVATTSDAAMAVADATTLGLQIPSTSPSTVNSIDGETALTALSGGGPVIRNLDRCHLLATMLPELGECRTLLADDATHKYTVFEHTLQAVEVLDRLRTREGLISSLVRESAHVPEIILSLLLHDVGKLVDPAKHSEIGAEIAAATAKRWKLHPNKSRLVHWLIANHLVVPKLILRRDLADPKTASEFAELVQTPANLAALIVLTACDISAVHDTAFTPMTEGLLAELYARTAAELARRNPTEGSEFPAPVFPSHFGGDDSYAEFCELFPSRFAMVTPPGTMGIQRVLYDRAKSGEVAVSRRTNRELGATDIMFACPDKPGLLVRALGILYAHNVQPENVRAFTSLSAPFIALDTLTVTHNHGPIPDATALALERSLRAHLLSDDASVEEEVTRHHLSLPDEDTHTQFRINEGYPLILEFRAPASTDLAYRLSRKIRAHGWNVQSARFSHWAGKSSATFYITGPENAPLTRTEVEVALSRKV